MLGGFTPAIAFKDQSNMPTIYYRTEDPVENLKIRVVVREVSFMVQYLRALFHISNCVVLCSFVGVQSEDIQ